MTSKSHPDQEQLAAYARAKLPEPAAEAVADHLDRCPACEATVTSLEKEGDTVLSALRQAPIPEAFSDEPECRQAVERIRVMEPQQATVAHVPSGGPEPEMSGRTPVPSLLREYQLLEKLGQGGMGTVYKALHTKLDKLVALKVLPAAAMSDAELVARFEREMKAVGKLEHPNIVRAMDAGCHEGTHFLVMEYVDGLDLSEVVKRCGKLRIADACEVIRQAAIGLRHADEHALVHRDIKPSNLVLNADGEIKILDLGLALLQADPRPGEEATGRGRAMGTIDYIAPEQVRDSHRVDIRADLYSLGCTLYKLLTGQSPFSGPRYENTFDKMMAHLNDPVPPVRKFRPDVPERLAAVLDRMVAKDRDARYAKPGLVAEELKPFCPGCDLAGLLMQARKETEAEAAVPGPAAPALGAGLPTPPERATARSPKPPACAPEPPQPGRPVGRDEGGVRRPAPSAQGPAPSAQSPTSSVQSPAPQPSLPTPNSQLPPPFDPYHKWLGIPPAEQPPNHYRLLGIPLFEADRDVIQAAAERQTVFLRNVALGKHSKQSQRLLNEVHQAKLRLLTPDEKVAYDARLRKELAAKAAPEAAAPALGAGLLTAAIGAGLPTPPNATTARSPIKVRAAARVWGSLRRSPRYALVASACAAAVVLLGVIYVTTNKGTVKIELSDPAAKVEVKVDGNEIEIAGLEAPLRLSVGEHALLVTSGEFQTVTESFTVRRGIETLLRVTLASKDKPAASGAVVPSPPVDGQGAPRWLGYMIGLTQSPKMLSEVASHTNLALFTSWRSAGRANAVFGEARRQGMKVLLGVGAGTHTKVFLADGPSLWAENRDVVIGAVLERPPQGFDLADWCREFKQAMPGAQLWLIPGRDDPQTPIPSEVDMVVLGLDQVESPAQVQTFCENELPLHLKQFEGPRTMVAWNDPVGQEPPGCVPTCKAGTFRAVAKMVQDHHLAGVLFATYGPRKEFVGLQTRPDLVAEIKEIAKQWRIGSDAAAGLPGSGHAKGPQPGPLPKGEGTDAAKPVMARAVQDVDRKAAEWVLGIGGSIGISTAGGGVRRLDAAESLPAERFTLVRVTLRRNASVTDEGLKNLAGLGSLQDLVLNQTKITDAGCTQLKDLATLRELSLISTGITDEGLRRLKTLTNLKHLRIGDTRISEAGLEHLGGFTGLEGLGLMGLSWLSDAQLERVPALENLWGLDLSNTSISDKGLAALKRFRKLRNLRLRSTAISDAGLETLREIKSLEILSLGGSRVTAAGVARLQAALPHCKIQTRNVVDDERQESLNDAESMDLGGAGVPGAGKSPRLEGRVRDRDTGELRTARVLVDVAGARLETLGKEIYADWDAKWIPWDKPLSAAALRTADLLVVSHCAKPKTYSKEEQDAVKRFVEHGGGLLIGGITWSGIGYEKYREEDYPPNQLAALFGMRMRGGYAGDPFRFAGHPITHGLKDMEKTGGMDLGVNSPIDVSGQAMPLIWDRDGKVVYAGATHGKGRVCLMPMNHLVNRAILDKLPAYAALHRNIFGWLIGGAE